jgi:L-serine dehydratase
MTLSVLDLFKIGIGPSSSHTVGPMIAARRYLESLRECAGDAKIGSIIVELFGSLAWTGKGHATDRALLYGLSGERPDSITAERMEAIVTEYERDSRLTLPDGSSIPFAADAVRWLREQTLPYHPNGMRFRATDHAGIPLPAAIYYSVGGGFVVSESETSGNHGTMPALPALPFPFTTAREMLHIGHEEKLAIANIVLANERCFRPEEETRARLDAVWGAMNDSIERGMRTGGVLPGGLELRRQASAMFRRLELHADTSRLGGLDWINCYALAVNEENAAGGRVVTAPTNGAAGIIPAVLKYYTRCYRDDPQLIRRFLLTAGAIGMLYKWNASLSAAEMGCQGEVGVACSMAAGGLAALLGGSNAQIENAAEIGMEHNLGLTCDPVKGLVQVPCIERNAMGAVKAVNAARLAVLHGDGRHLVALDSVIRTMKQTGLDMQGKYKETSTGGLAVNVPYC